MEAAAAAAAWIAELTSGEELSRGRLWEIQDAGWDPAEFPEIAVLLSIHQDGHIARFEDLQGSLEDPAVLDRILRICAQVPWERCIVGFEMLMNIVPSQVDILRFMVGMEPVTERAAFWARVAHMVDEFMNDDPLLAFRGGVVTPMLLFTVSQEITTARTPDDLDENLQKIIRFLRRIDMDGFRACWATRRIPVDRIIQALEQREVVPILLIDILCSVLPSRLQERIIDPLLECIARCSQDPIFPGGLHSLLKAAIGLQVHHRRRTRCIELLQSETSASLAEWESFVYEMFEPASRDNLEPLLSAIPERRHAPLGIVLHWVESGDTAWAREQLAQRFSPFIQEMSTFGQRDWRFPWESAQPQPQPQPDSDFDSDSDSQA